MEKKKNNSILVVLLILIIVVLIYSIYKLYERHNDNLYKVLYENIEYKAKKCYLEDKCDKEFSLKDLYEQGYLDTQYDPVSKEELDSNIKIEIKKDKVIIDK